MSRVSLLVLLTGCFTLPKPQAVVLVETTPQWPTATIFLEIDGQMRKWEGEDLTYDDLMSLDDNTVDTGSSVITEADLAMVTAYGNDKGHYGWAELAYSNWTAEGGVVNLWVDYADREGKPDPTNRTRVAYLYWDAEVESCYSFHGAKNHVVICGADEVAE